MKRYKVIGDRAVLGREPGEVFEEEIPEAQEQRMLNRGSIKILGSPSKATKAQEGDKPRGSLFPGVSKVKEESENG